MTVTDRLNEFVRVAFAGKVPAITSALGWPRTALYKYLKGTQEPGKVLLDKIAEIGGNPLWISRGEGSMYADNAAGRALRARVEGEKAQHWTVEQLAEDIGLVKLETPIRERIQRHLVEEDVDGLRVLPRPGEIPLFLNPAAAGKPTWAEGDLEGWLNLEHYLVADTEATYTVRAKGKSMLYDGIHEGDLLIVNRQEVADSGNVIVAAVNGAVCVKRLERVGRAVWLMPSNGEFEPELVTKEMKFKVLGVVRHVIHTLR